LVAIGQNALMHPTRKLSGFMLPLAAALVIGCGGAGPGWTFAPLGPTAPPTAPPTPSAGPTAVPSGAPTAVPSGAPSAAPTGSSQPGLTLELVTPEANSLAFEPSTLEAPADTVVTVNYLNDSSLQHNVNFFNGPDQTAESLGATAVVTGPGNTQSVTFTTPASAGDYFFWCDVHGFAMVGTLHVTAQ
jgi:plastocyanin